ncbi:hypothetical protein IAE37_005364 [Pseudomonas sp. S31]|nr:hypothetical protein [Pseudomonas sp. S31]
MQVSSSPQLAVSYQEGGKAKEDRMSLAMTLFSLISAWLAVALAMLWGVLRIARRHQRAETNQVVSERPPANAAGRGRHSPAPAR